MGSAGPPDALGWGSRTPESGLRGWLMRSAAPGSADEAGSREMTAEALRRLLSLEARRVPLMRIRSIVEPFLVDINIG